MYCSMSGGPATVNLLVFASAIVMITPVRQFKSVSAQLTRQTIAPLGATREEDTPDACELGALLKEGALRALAGAEEEARVIKADVQRRVAVGPWDGDGAHAPGRVHVVRFRALWDESGCGASGRVQETASGEAGEAGCGRVQAG